MPGQDRYLVTGVAGFIGSHLAESLLTKGQKVIGIDALTGNYSRPRKQANLSALRPHPNFRFIQGDLTEIELSPLLAEVDIILHLAGEHLSTLYARQFGLPVVSLRFFTVFGPRQRPDMAFARFIQALRIGQEIAVFGDGDQTRDFTYVDDVVAAMHAAARADLGNRIGPIYNIGGGTRVSLRSAITLLEEITHRKARLRMAAPEPGDIRHTWADCNAARADLAFSPATTLRSGLTAQVEWELAQEAFADVAA